MKPIMLMKDARGFYWVPALTGGGVLALFSDRRYDFALPQIRQRQRLGASLGIPGNLLVGVRQVHGAEVAIIKRVPALTQEIISPVIPDRDALITNLPGIALSVLTADCLPVILCDARNKAIGIAHCGWRGLAAGVLRKTVMAMNRSFGSDPAGIHAYIGPGIRACCYRVGPELRAHFKTAMRQRQGKWYLDLVKVAAGQLTRAGVSQRRINDTDRCSCCDKEFFSYRRGDDHARMLSLVMRMG